MSMDSDQPVRSVIARRSIGVFTAVINSVFLVLFTRYHILHKVVQVLILGEGIHQTPPLLSQFPNPIKN